MCPFKENRPLAVLTACVVDRKTHDLPILARTEEEKNTFIDSQYFGLNLRAENTNTFFVTGRVEKAVDNLQQDGQITSEGCYR